MCYMETKVRTRLTMKMSDAYIKIFFFSPLVYRYPLFFSFIKTMATLSSFGFKKGVQCSAPIDKIEHRHPFISPAMAPIQKKQILPKPSNKKSIKHYFLPIQHKPEEQEQEEEAIICVVRKKLPISTMWDMIQAECEQQELLLVPSIHSSRHKRAHSNVDSQHDKNKKKKRTDQSEMTSIMQRFLHM
ncbi:uncharacterized protein B0P05DRAFT_523043 [Gilbertella persicaria]|uniref:uncharacterized protein n=1 Tax=Gilbertella persicaria TaxID=101096 RepID=UPI00221F13FD|nr:uncharacterized protein B0P05DRAFT_523043 [Gilbertella persicaria]KAI8098026.1 hypothetical protein B0P05DRAFT_523043 [Gilbertella persicaria]